MGHHIPDPGFYPCSHMGSDVHDFAVDKDILVVSIHASCPRFLRGSVDRTGDLEAALAQIGGSLPMWERG